MVADTTLLSINKSTDAMVIGESDSVLQSDIDVSCIEGGNIEESFSFKGVVIDSSMCTTRSTPLPSAGVSSSIPKPLSRVKAILLQFPPDEVSIVI